MFQQWFKHRKTENQHCDGCHISEMIPGTDGGSLMKQNLQRYIFYLLRGWAASLPRLWYQFRTRSQVLQIGGIQLTKLSMGAMAIQDSSIVIALIQGT